MPHRSPHSLVAGVLLALVAAACGSDGDESSLTTPPVLPGEVDLSVAKSVDDASVGEGEDVLFTIDVTNSALGSAATGVHARDLLPAGLTFVSAAPGQGSYDALTGVWSIGDMAIGASTTLELRASVDAGTVGSTLVNQVDDLGADQVDPNATNDVDQVSVDVVATLDVAVAKGVDVAAPEEGQTIVYTVEVTHVAGATSATGIAVVDALPPGVAYVSHTLTVGTYVPVTGRWSGFALAPGGSEELTITATVELGTGGSTIANEARLTELDQQDIASGNDASTASISVSNDTNLALTKVVNDATPSEGNTVTFTVSLVNEGPAFASNVVVTDLLPAGTTYQFHNQDVGVYTKDTGVWAISGLAPGPLERKLVISALVDAGTGGTTIVNTATLSALDQDDTLPGDDSASASIAVDANADLALALVVDDASPTRRQPVVLTLTLSNALGGARATGVTVSMPLPAGLAHQSHVAGIGSYSPGSGLWNVGDVDAGQSFALVVTTGPEIGTSGQTLDVLATVASSDQPDPNAANDSDAVAIAVDGEVVEIVSDVFGVPHVFANSDEGACFGMGYATAKNRLSQMTWSRLVATGRIAEFFGRGANDEFLKSDRRVRLYGLVRHAVEAAGLLDPETRALLQAYADGVNAYLTSPGVALHPVLAQEGVPLEAWRVVDSIAIWNEFGRSFGPSELTEAEKLHEFEDLVAQLLGDVQQALDQLLVPSIFDDAAAVVKQSDVPASVQQAMADYASAVGMGSIPLVAVGSSPEFSQAWAVTPDKTLDGKPLLVADPRIPILRPNLLHEIHVRGATFDVRGAGPPGAFALLVGSTPDVAWGATALGLDQADLFRIEMVPGQPGQYRLDGVARPFEVDAVEMIAIKGQAPEPLHYRETVFGPLVTDVVKDAQGEEFAVRSTLFYEPEKVAAKGYLDMFRASGVVQFGTALGEMGYPSMNVVFADSTGRIGYWASGAVPARSVASPVSAFGGRAALDGNVSANDWLQIVPHDLMPWVLDPSDDVLFSANHMPIGSWYPIRIGLDQNSTGDTSRSRRLRELLVGAPKLGPSHVDSIRNDTVYGSARDAVRLALHAKAVHSAAFTGDTERALTELKPWLEDAGAKLEAVGPNGPNMPGERGVLIASFIEDTFRPATAGDLIAVYGGGAAGAANFYKTRIAELASGTALLTSDEIDYLDRTLADALKKAETISSDPTKWLGKYEANVLTIDFPAWTDLNGFESLDPLDVLQVGPLTSTDTRILGSQSEEAYGQHVRVGSIDETLSLSPFGQGEPGSAHAQDQLDELEAQTLRPSPMSRAEVEALGPFTVDTLVF